MISKREFIEIGRWLRESGIANDGFEAAIMLMGAMDRLGIELEK